MAENMEWENEAPHLAKLKKSNSFTVPTNYFEELGERINQSVFISSLKKNEHLGFHTPANYFETLEEKITSRVALEHLHNKKNQGFTVPAGYFNNLQQRIATKTTGTQKTIKLWQQPLLKYAIAASFVVMATTAWFTNQRYNEKQLRKTELAKEQLLYDIDESVILEYIQENQNVKTVNMTDGEMEHYILENFSTNELPNNL